jgi:hypothetical protein
MANQTPEAPLLKRFANLSALLQASGMLCEAELTKRSISRKYYAGLGATVVR